MIAHVGGLPVEETLGSFGPALLVGLGVAWAKLRARLRPGAPSRRRSRSGQHGRASRPADGSDADEHLIRLPSIVQRWVRPELEVLIA